MRGLLQSGEHWFITLLSLSDIEPEPLLSAPDETPQKENPMFVGCDPTVSVFAAVSLVQFYVPMYFQSSSKTIPALTANVPGLVAHNTTVPPAPS